MSEYTEHVWQEYHYKGYEPIHQREQIVRCAECRFSCFEGERCRKWKRTVALNDYEFMEVAAKVEPDGFCKWGER